MRDSVIWFLVSSVVVSALATVYVRHQHRMAYSAFQQEQHLRDELGDEWGKLLLEENTWAFLHRIEKDASEILAMRAPAPDEVKLVNLLSKDSASPSLEER